MDKEKAIRELNNASKFGLAEVVFSNKDAKYYILTTPERGDGTYCEVYDFDYTANELVEVAHARVECGDYFAYTNADYTGITKYSMEPFETDDNGVELYSFYTYRAD